MKKEKTKETSKKNEGLKVNRRKFLKTAAAGAAGAAALGFPMVSRAQTVTLKMQGSWGAKDIFNEYAEDYVTRVNEMGGGRLVIDYLVSGAVVKAFQVQDAVNKGVLDAAHSVCLDLFRRRPGTLQ
jgi:TRAP-type mannitol/chloroaromatic compound transport system substrate-binding protein